MRESPHLLALATAVAEGRQPDWLAAHSAAADADERALLRELRAIAEIGTVVARLTSVSSVAADEPPYARSTPDAQTGRTWGGLHVLDPIGSGRFGDVYRAWDPSLDRIVALKLVRQSAQTAEDGARVIHEGSMMARVRHPNVAAVYGAQRVDGQVGLWMEYVEGRTLHEELRVNGPLSPADLITVGTDLCRALAAVHQAGVVHRDVKAQNVIREPSGRIVLADFGTGRELEAIGPSRRDMAGTPAYLAPEIFQGQPATARSDLYSLGVLLFLLATGDFPVTGASVAELRAAHNAGRRSALRGRRNDLPRALTQTIERALDPDPTKRFPSAEDFASALSVSVGPQAPASPRSRDLTLRHVAGVLGVVLTLICSTIGTGVTRSDARSGAARARELYALAIKGTAAHAVPDDREAALQLLRQAVKDDPDFAFAHVLIAELTPDERQRAHHIDRATAAAEGAPEIEHLEVAARTAFMKAVLQRDPVEQQRGFEHAAGAFEAWLRVAPNHPRATAQLAALYTRTGRERQGRDLVVKLADMTPQDAHTQVDAAQALLAANTATAAARYVDRARQAQAANPSLPASAAVWLAMYDSLAGWMTGDVEASLLHAAAVQADVGRAPGSHRRWLGLYLVSTYLTLGRLDDAETAVRLIPDLAEQEVYRALILAQREQREQLRHYLQARFADPERAARVGSLWADVEDTGRLKQVVARTPLLLYRGQLALATGNAKEAVHLLELARHRETTAGTPGRSRAARKLADALLATGDLRRAIAALEEDSHERALQIVGVPTGYEWLRARSRLAELYRQAGRVQDAVAVENDLLALLRVADATHPIRRRLERQQSRNPRQVSHAAHSRSSPQSAPRADSPVGARGGSDH